MLAWVSPMYNVYNVVNRYYKNSQISEAKFLHLWLCFALDLTASDTARITCLNVRSVNDIYQKICLRAANVCEQKSVFMGQVEVAEASFGPRRTRGRSGCGAANKIIVFSLLKRHGRVSTETVLEAKKPTWQDIIRGKTELESVIYSDGGRVIMA